MTTVPLQYCQRDFTVRDLEVIISWGRVQRLPPTWLLCATHHIDVLTRQPLGTAARDVPELAFLFPDKTTSPLTK